jgi:hypothetical protein
MHPDHCERKPGGPRRFFAALLAWTVFTAVAPAEQSSQTPPIADAIRDAARPLPLDAVRLTGGPLKHAQDLNAAYLLALEPHRMLAFYRKRAGLEPKAEPYGGWDGDGRNLTGHIAGHYLSGVSLMWASTGDVRFKERVDYTSKSSGRFRTSTAMAISARSPAAAAHSPSCQRERSDPRPSI